MTNRFKNDFDQGINSTEYTYHDLLDESVKRFYEEYLNGAKKIRRQKIISITDFKNQSLRFFPYLRISSLGFYKMKKDYYN